MAEQLPIAVLVSGEGTNLQALLDRLHGREVRVVAVASSRGGVRALERARAAGVAAESFELAAYESRDARDAAIAAWLDQHGARLVVLAGYMALLGPELLGRFPGAVINVHPSLLPSFPGLDAVGQALAYGVKVFGVTVHFVDDGVDTGPVILQRALELPDADDAEAVRVALRPLEHDLLTDAVRLAAEGRLRADAENERCIRVDEPLDTLPG